MAGEQQNSCLRCGACCQEGGPALHRQDLALLQSGKIPLNRLITIRKGELVHNPKSGRVQRVASELVKIAGNGHDWRCSYYAEAGGGCGIYSHRPQACEALKCWDTAAIFDLIEEDLLSRLAILPEAHPLVPEIIEQERICPCPDLEVLVNDLPDLPAELKVEIEALAGRDLHLRTRAVQVHGLSLADELFYFGRPLFQLLQQLGVGVQETAAGIALHWPGTKENGP